MYTMGWHFERFSKIFLFIFPNEICLPAFEQSGKVARDSSAFSYSHYKMIIFTLTKHEEESCLNHYFTFFEDVSGILFLL